MPTSTTEQSIFLAALELKTPAERNAYLKGACAGNQELFENVQSLLAVQHQSEDFLERPPVDYTLAHRPISEGPGTVIGPYKLLQQIGEGGMGVVYMAEQSQPIKRRVALKIIKPGMETKEVVARFEAERQALALMDHPNIAKVFDGGATESGRPYFVMELVKGIPLTQFCDESKLDTRQRLELFAVVCKAIQHAHQKGVIHRDIKPSNVMVTLHDGEPVPKVIDFGVSKAVTQQLTEKTMFTVYGQMIGTPAYMSPEQAEMSGLDIDTRSDIYSLGVLLYELLTGSTPLENTSIRGKAYGELQRMIREEEAEKPSLRLSTRGEATASVAAHRNTDAKRLGALLRGELDWIVMKTLEKNRDRRYETANGLAADIDRYLSGEAILARPPSVVYKLQKFVGRNKAAALSGLAVLVALLAGTAVATWQAVRATREQHIALVAAQSEREAKETSQSREAETNAVLDFMEKQVFNAGRPEGEGLGEGATLRRVIEGALPSLDKSFDKQPLIAARLRMLMGSALMYEQADELAAKEIEKALAVYTQHLGPDNPVTASCMYQLGFAYSQVGRNADAIKITEETLAIRKRVLGLDHLDTARSMLALANAYNFHSRPAEAWKLETHALEILTAKLGPNHPETIRVARGQAFWLRRANKHDEAIAILERILVAELGESSSDSKSKLTTLLHLAREYEKTNRPEEALRINEDIVSRSTQASGKDHGSTLAFRYALSSQYARLGRYQDALRIDEESLALAKAKYGANRRWTVIGMSRVAEKLFQLDRDTEGMAITNEVLQRPELSKWHREFLPALMMHYAKINDVVSCRQAAEKWETEIRKDDNIGLYNAACNRALIASVFKSNTSSDALRLANEEADRAMAWLKKAVAAGYDSISNMEQDHDLDVLRERADFKLLLAELKKNPAIIGSNP